MSDAKPHPKSVQLARGERRYRRIVASPKQWEAIRAEKLGPCRVCLDAASNGRMYGHIQLHHVVKRGLYFGDDIADNIVPLCPGCHEDVTRCERFACEALCASLTDAEYSYATRKAKNYFERAYGIEYTR